MEQTLNTYVINISWICYLLFSTIFIRNSVTRLRSFFTILSDRSNLRSQRSDGNRCLVSSGAKKKKKKRKKEKNGAGLWTVCERGGGKNFEKIHGWDREKRVQFSKVKSSGVTRRLSFHLSPSPPPSFRENGEKVSRSLERTEADIDYYTPSRIETRLETFRAQPRF